MKPDDSFNVVFYPKHTSNNLKTLSEKFASTPDNKSSNISPKELKQLVRLCNYFGQSHKPIAILGYESTIAISWMYEVFPKDFLKQVPIECIYYGTRKKFKKNKKFLWSTLTNDEIKTVFVPSFKHSSEQGRKMLGQLLSNRSAVILTGGIGHPEDPFYKPVLDALEQLVNEGTVITGSCMAHELVSVLHKKMGKSESKLASQFFEFGPQSQEQTLEGRKLPFIKNLPTEISVFHGNEHVVSIEGLNRNTFLNGKVLLRSKATDLPTAILWDFKFPHQALTIQGHPEIQLGDDGKAPSALYKFIVEKDFQEVVNYFREKYYFSKLDEENLLDRRRLCQNLGFGWYGRVLLYLLQEKKRN